MEDKKGNYVAESAWFPVRTNPGVSEKRCAKRGEVPGRPSGMGLLGVEVAGVVKPGMRSVKWVA